MPKQPQAILDAIFAFSPNRDTLGATAYFIVENDANILIDCPALDEINLEFLQQHGGARWLFITHRGAIGKAEKIQEAIGCEIVIQEQEAYLMPGLKVTTFERELTLSPTTTALWTPGHSPGSSCLYYKGNGGVLFTGRHLLPDRHGDPAPLRTSKTFHWLRQLRSVEWLRDRFSPKSASSSDFGQGLEDMNPFQGLQYICPGANTGFLRGEKAIARAYERLSQLDLTAARDAQPLL